MRSAESALTAAQGHLTYARSAFERQRQLLATGPHAPSPVRIRHKKALQNAQAQVDDAEARLEIARDRVSWTTLTADAEGTVTARGAEPGEWCKPGR